MSPSDLAQLAMSQRPPIQAGYERGADAHGLEPHHHPTLYHPQYDCARALTRGNDPRGFVRSLAKMARWASQFDYSNLDALIRSLRATNALEESPAQFRLLNADGSYEA